MSKWKTCKEPDSYSIEQRKIFWNKNTFLIRRCNCTQTSFFIAFNEMMLVKIMLPLHTVNGNVITKHMASVNPFYSILFKKKNSYRKNHSVCIVIVNCIYGKPFCLGLCCLVNSSTSKQFKIKYVESTSNGLHEKDWIEFIQLLIYTPYVIIAVKYALFLCRHKQSSCT